MQNEKGIKSCNGVIWGIQLLCKHERINLLIHIQVENKKRKMLKRLGSEILIHHSL